MRNSIADVDDVAWAGLARLRGQLRPTPLDEQFSALVELAEAAVAEIPRAAELTYPRRYRGEVGP